MKLNDVFIKRNVEISVFHLYLHVHVLKLNEYNFCIAPLDL